jgi:predicted alpha/beta-hydrolase family hydrolase
MAEPLPQTSERLVPTPHGDARVIVRAAREPRLTLLLQHGAGGGLDARDLVALATRLPADGITTVLLQQPFSVAGRKVAPRAAVLDECLAAVVPNVRRRPPLVLAGRSAGARCSTRLADQLDAVACLALAFPLHPPGHPEKSRVDELLGVQVPTLVVQGAKDPFGQPGEFPRLPSHMRLVPVRDADHGFAVPKRAKLSQDRTVDLIVDTVRDWLLEHVVPLAD